MAQLKDIAAALGVTPQRVTALVRLGMPTDSIEAAVAWRSTREDGRRRPAPKAVAPDALDDGTLAHSIEAHKALVSQARGVWQAAMDQGDSNQGKFQTAYNQSFKTLLDLEAEQERRLKESRTFILRTEAEATVRAFAGEVLARLDKLALEVAEKVNPDNPPLAVKVLDAWCRSVRIDLSRETQAEEKADA